MPTAPKTSPKQRTIRRLAFVSAFDEEPPDQPSDLLATQKRRAKIKTAKIRFSKEAKAALLNAVASHSWTTCREAYGWAWNELGLRVNYITVWRFFNAQGLLCGNTPRARRLASPNVSPTITLSCRVKNG
jgi:hypothetical protein